MTTETMVWTVLIFGGTVLVVLWLTAIAWRKEAHHEHDDAE